MLAGGGFSLDADGPSGGSSPLAAVSRDPKQRRAKRAASRRLSVPEWKVGDDDVDSFVGSSSMPPSSDRATYSGATRSRGDPVLLGRPVPASSRELHELELPTQIPMTLRPRGDSRGSGSEATPLLRGNREPPPPSPLGGSLGVAWAVRIQAIHCCNHVIYALTHCVVYYRLHRVTLR
jgi:hypothetical protein